MKHTMAAFRLLKDASCAVVEQIYVVRVLYEIIVNKYISVHERAYAYLP